MLPISSIARVIVNTVRSSASPAAFDTGLMLARKTDFEETERLFSYGSAQEAETGLLAAGFAQGSVVVKSAIKYFAVSPAPSRLLVSCYPSSENLIQALGAALDQNIPFYGVMAANDSAPAAQDAADFVTYIEGLEQPAVLFLASGAMGSGSVINLLNQGNHKRALVIYSPDLSDAGAVMGLAMGLELSHRNGAFALCYKNLQGVRPCSAPASVIQQLEGLNSNVYVQRGSSHLGLELGSVMSGERYDEVLYMDKIAKDLQDAAVTLIADNPDKLPQTDDATAQFINRFSSILIGYTNRGILASAVWRGPDTGPLRTGDLVENGFLLWADSYDLQSDADRAAHKAMPVQCALTLAGSIESIVITVNVQL